MTQTTTFFWLKKISESTALTQGPCGVATCNRRSLGTVKLMCATYANTINDPSTLKRENKAFRIRHIHQVRRKRLPVMLTIRKAGMKSWKNVPQNTSHERWEKIVLFNFSCIIEVAEDGAVCLSSSWMRFLHVDWTMDTFSSKKRYAARPDYHLEITIHLA